ncbi:parathyroid hormone/parathyroid hormone-related peptide receptor-like isoform X1 [Haliotis rufescens]|uniref:parathyroid hormone/parathyroid hormone-related peptide receptor-like isoform X1 n=1 Tax=Haliotis rufescens TaxID=6454 RepID=UPI00201EF69D|nr:parathyroid hormone/parathyroid hormone-related peptide receptor-like isoform X1 [Haliotis rufescens]
MFTVPVHEDDCKRCPYERICIMCFTLSLGVTLVFVVPSLTVLQSKDAGQVVSVMSKTEQRKLLLRAKVRCYRKMVRVLNTTSQDPRDGPAPCVVAWDDILCWDETPPGTMAQQTCPDYVNGFNKNEFARRYCDENGSWWVNPANNYTWTNFSACEKPAIDLRYHADIANKLRLLYTVGYSVSLSALVVAVIIMLCCRRLKSKSNILHINLFIAFILRASVSFLKDLLFKGVGLDMDVRLKSDGTYEFLDGPHWQCKLLFCLFNYTITASIMWIFIEGLYLHMLIYRTLSTERNGVSFYIVLGWVLPLVFLIPWIVVKAVLENTYCWNIQTRSEFLWILKGPGIAVVLINFFFFLDIFRILFLRARANQRHLGKAKYKKLAKFILVLIPLFGLMYIILIVAFPAEFTQDDYNLFYLYIEMGYNSFQGFLLALLFCFLNEEVHAEIKKMWYRHKSRRADDATFTKSLGASSWRKSSGSKSSPASERRQGDCSRQKVGSTCSCDHDKSDHLLKKALIANAKRVVSEHNTEGDQGGGNSIESAAISRDITACSCAADV